MHKPGRQTPHPDPFTRRFRPTVVLQLSVPLFFYLLFSRLTLSSPIVCEPCDGPASNPHWYSGKPSSQGLQIWQRHLSSQCCSLVAAPSPPLALLMIDYSIVNHDWYRHEKHGLTCVQSWLATVDTRSATLGPCIPDPVANR